MADGSLPEEMPDYRPDKESLSNSEVMAGGILAQGSFLNVAKELVALRGKYARLKAKYAFEENQALCISFAGGCDGDLEGVPHEDKCPAQVEDKQLRPRLYQS